MRVRVLDLSLRTKLVALCAGVVLAVAAVLLVELPRAMDAQSMSWVTSRSLGLGRLLASALEAPVDFDDASAAHGTLGGLHSSRGAVYALLLGAKGEEVARWGSIGSRQPLPPDAGEETLVAGGLLHVRVPIVTRSGRRAELLLGFGLEELRDRRREVRTSVLLTTGVSLVAALAAALVLGTLLARPLQRMTEVARRVADGQVSEATALPLDRHDELGVLAAAFAQMLEKLYAQQAHIGKINADLAERVRERTQELARTSEALSQLERTQQQLVLADRRISVGRLAAGVAHEVNNPLAFLSGNLEFVSQELPELLRLVDRGDSEARVAARHVVEELCGAVADSRQGARRVTHIVRGLKTFARDDDDRRENLRLDGPVEAAIEMALHEIKHRARLVRRYGTVPWVLASEVRLSQVFLNLLINAAQALPEGSTEEQQIVVSIGVAPDGRAMASVADTGCGMPSEVMARIFDPFFTTKPIGVGSGLGLPISRNIVTASGGDITVESTPGQGTTFTVLLPQAGAEKPAEPEEEEAPAVALSGLSLLVVDDEPLVGDVVRRLLGREAEIHFTHSGRQALDEIAAGQRYDCILCDLMMPELSGPELFAQLTRAVPEQASRVVVMTGGAFTEEARSFLDHWRGPLLEKPLSADKLRRVIHALVS